MVLLEVLGVWGVFLEYLNISFVKDEIRNDFITKILTQTCGAGAAILLMVQMKIRLFGKPQKLLYLIPCFIVAIDNFQFYSYFQGNMSLARTGAWDFVLFGLQCLSVGIFEECVFRGIVFVLVAGFFTDDKKGFIMTFIVSSLIFGAAHLFNGSILQVGYTILTGGLFAFAMIKTKNIFCAGLVHAVYNFGGMLFSNVGGLGNGVVFDLGTGITMAIVGVLAGLFVLYSIFKTSEAERSCLYAKLNIKAKKPKTEETNQ